MFAALINPLAILMSFSTATGILVHDMHLDAAASTILAMPATVANYDTTNKLAGFGDSHAHVERGTMTQAIIQLQSQNPRIQPRASEDRKHLLQNRVVRGHHAFDNYSLPIV